MRFFWVVLATLFLSASAQAAVVQIQYTEPTVNVGGGAIPLRHTTIYKANGATGTDWQPIRSVNATAGTGAGSIDVNVTVPLNEDDLPRTIRFGYSSTDTSFNTSTIVAIPTGNPVTFTEP